MTFKLFNKVFAIEFRNGFGIDLEVCHSRPIFVTKAESFEPIAACFNGLVLLLPFLIVLLGEPYDIEE